MYCKKCGSKISKDSNFCEKCGAKVEVEEMEEIVDELLEDDEHIEIDPQKPEFMGFVQNGSIHRMLLINESGLYNAIFNSTLKAAKRFKHWVTSEVLPTIRKTGSYHLPQTYSEALRELANTVEENERLKLENNEMRPKAEFFDAVTDSKDAIEMRNVAKVLDMGIGRNKLFEFLRKQGILMRDNTPYQKYIDAGYFRTIEQKYDKGYGEIGINIKTLVFQKGVDFIRKSLMDCN